MKLLGSFTCRKAGTWDKEQIGIWVSTNVQVRLVKTNVYSVNNVSCLVDSRKQPYTFYLGRYQVTMDLGEICSEVSSV
jgi:hypothetical protein